MAEKKGTSITVQATGRDWVVSISKGLAGAVPVIGPLAGEVIGNVIPNQRVDRITRVLQALEARLDQVEQEALHAAFHDQDFIDLLEDGFFQAARARSQERIDRIAALLGRSVTEDEVGYLHAKRLLHLLGEVSDEEILILMSHSYDFMNDADFIERHQDILYAPGAHTESSQEEVDRDAIHHAYIQNLVRLGLIAPRFQTPRRDELPELDERTGMMKAIGHEATPLGQLLLRQLELIEQD